MERETLESLGQSYSRAGKSVNVGFGLRPSGVIHLGNMMTMSLAGLLGNRIGSHLANLNLTICDLDLPDVKDWDAKTCGYVKHYRDIPDSAGCHQTVYDHAMVDIKDFVAGLEGIVQTPISIRRLTDVHRDPAFREGLKRVLDDPKMMQLIMPQIKDDATLVYPLCPECGTSYTGTEKGKVNKYDRQTGVISTFCTNQACPVQDYKVDVLDTSKDIAVHLFIDMLRDASVPPILDVHVFGGDYLDLHGQNRIPKFEKIRRLISASTHGTITPDILVGPTVFSSEGDKMSKSLSNGLDIGQLRKYFGNDYVRKVFDFTKSMVERGFKVIDYSLVREELLKRA